MARILQEKDRTAVAVTQMNGTEAVLKDDFHDRAGIPYGGTDYKLFDISDISFDGSNTLASFYHLGFSSAYDSGLKKVRLKDQASDVQNAFKEAGFEIPPIIKPRFYKIRKAARALLAAK